MQWFSRPALAGRVLFSVLVFLLAGAPSAGAHADGPSVLTATVQTLFDPDPEFIVVWEGERVSALPLRLRVANEASPLAYSMDIRRGAEYGDSWTAISLGRPKEPQDRSLSQIGVANPLPASLVARGGAPSGSDPVLADDDLEYAARQVAIWSVTSGLPLDPVTVPSPALLARAQQLLRIADSSLLVPLQAAYHQIQVSVRETTPTTVRLIVKVTVDANARPSSPQDIDLILDGAVCPIRTMARTVIEANEEGVYEAGTPRDIPQRLGGAEDIAVVDLPRNTKVVGVSATWVGVVSEPGLVLISDGAAPPVMTADEAVLNFRTTASLDPSSYTRPEQILDSAGITILGLVPTWSIVPAILLALYLLPRIGRGIDAGLRRAFARRVDEDARVGPIQVEAEASSLAAAVEAGLSAFDSTTRAESQVSVVVRQTARGGWFRRARAARVVLRRSNPRDD